MKKVILFFSFIYSFSIVINLQAQKIALQRADNFYNNLNYYKAIPLYEKVTKKNDNIEVLTKLGDCYRLTNNIEKAANIYEKIINSGQNNPTNIYYYSKILISKGDYNKAVSLLKQCKGDNRCQAFLQSIENMPLYYKDTANCKISKVPFNSKNNDFGPTIYTANGKEQIIFVSSRLSTKLINHSDGWTGYYYNNLFVTEKKSNGKYKRVKLFSRKIQSYLNNGPVSFSSDMKKVYFTRNAMFNNKAQRSEDGKAKLQICQADYYNKKKTFDNVVEFAYNDYNYNFAYPVISSDGKYLYFASDCPGGYGGMDIWMCEWEGDRWGYPVNLGEKVNSAGNEIFPYIYGSDKLYFSSDGRGGLGGLDIFVTNINSLNGQPINNADNVGANINSLYDDFGIVFRADGKSGFVSSNRSSNDDNIYEFVIQNSF